MRRSLTNTAMSWLKFLLILALTSNIHYAKTLELGELIVQ